MKTVKQIADEVGVSKSSIHKKLNSEPIKSAIQRYAAFVGNKIYLDSNGEEMLKATFNKNFSEFHDMIDEVDGAVGEVDDLVDRTDNTVDEVDDLKMDFIVSLQKQIELLTLQNEDLREENNKLTGKILEQSERLFSLTEQAQKLAENAQALHAMENVRPRLASNKKSIFSKLFSRNK